MSHAAENSMHSKNQKTPAQRRASGVGSGRLVRRLKRIVTEDGKFAYGSATRCLDVVEHVFAAHRRMADRLQVCCQKHDFDTLLGKGTAGLPVDEIVVEALEKFLRFPPPVDNEFVAPGCERFAAPNNPVSHGPEREARRDVAL